MRKTQFIWYVPSHNQIAALFSSFSTTASHSNYLLNHRLSNGKHKFNTRNPQNSRNQQMGIRKNPKLRSNLLFTRQQKLDFGNFLSQSLNDKLYVEEDKGKIVFKDKQNSVLEDEGFRVLGSYDTRNPQNSRNQQMDIRKNPNLRSNLLFTRQQKFDFGNCLTRSLNDKLYVEEGKGKIVFKDKQNSVVEDEEFRVLGSYDNNFQQVGECSKRYEIDESEFRHPLVRETCRLIGLRLEWNPELEGKLRNLLRSLKPHQVCAVLHSQDDERIALEFFYWAHRQWRYRHHPVVYYAMLRILGKTKMCEGARRVLQLMCRRGICCTPEAFRCLMISYSRAGKVRHAIGVIKMMQNAGVQPDLSIYNTVLHVLVMANRLGKALRFLKKMQMVGIVPDVVTYNCLIKGYCSVDKVKDAIKLIEDMPRRGCHPDKVSFYTVINYYCKEKNMVEIQVLLEKMMSCNLLLDMVTYNNIIHMLCKYGHSDEAYDFIKQAQERGFRMDKVSYTALIHSLCRNGKVDRAQETINEMLAKDCIPDVVTYTAIVGGLCRVGRVNEAKEMLQQMYKNGCKPNTVTYTALLNGLCHIGCSSEAREMMNKSEEEWWTPNAITFSVLMHGFHREGKLFEACDVVRDMMMNNFLPSPAEINLLLVSLCQEGRTDEAKKFMQECLSKGCDINVVNFTAVINGYVQKDDLEGALSLLDDMYLVNKKPDIVTYTTIIDALGRRGKFDEAADLVNKMLRRGILPNPIMYSMLIHRFSQHGKVEDLLKLLEKLFLKQPCQNAYNQIIEKLCSFGYLSEAYHLIGKALRRASKLDAHSCHVLMQNYLSNGNPLMAYKVACRMFRRNLPPDFNLCKKVSEKLTIDGNIKEAKGLMIQFVERGLISPC